MNTKNPLSRVREHSDAKNERRFVSLEIERGGSAVGRCVHATLAAQIC
ncbi:MAG: hypothetical protein FWH56_08235 [Betaproteobacteria bacterium]|nr:hypothetical protein [Betaproteobacteria bacterium]